MSATLPVLVVGAGPAGLTLACELARRGVACRVVDKAPQLFVGSRAKGLQPRTLEVFDDLGVIDAVRAGGAPFPPFRLYAGAALQWERSLEELLGVPPSPPSPAVPYPRPWLIPQWRTDRILRDRFVELGGEVELATELTGLSQDGGGVTATLRSGGATSRVRAQFLVGADGGRSFVRKAAGVAFAGETYPSERTLIGDVRVEALDAVACHIFTRAGDATSRFSLWNLPQSEHYQLVANVAADDDREVSLSTVRRLFEERSGRDDIRLHDLRWSSLYRINVRMVDSFRSGRVLLAGDAAHVHSSAGGQGLNTSIQDAYNLGWKLAAVLAGATDKLLDTYDEERRPVAAQVLGVSSRLHKQDFRPSPAPTPALHQLDISYRGRTLAVDDRSQRGDLQAGDRAPDARLADGSRLFDVLRRPDFTLVAVGHAAAATAPVPTHHVRFLEGYESPTATSC